MSTTAINTKLSPCFSLALEYGDLPTSPDANWLLKEKIDPNNNDIAADLFERTSDGVIDVDSNNEPKISEENSFLKWLHTRSSRCINNVTGIAPMNAYGLITSDTTLTLTTDNNNDYDPNRLFRDVIAKNALVEIQTTDRNSGIAADTDTNTRIVIIRKIMDISDDVDNNKYTITFFDGALEIPTNLGEESRLSEETKLPMGDTKTATTLTSNEKVALRYIGRRSEDNPDSTNEKNVDTFTNNCFSECRSFTARDTMCFECILSKGPACALDSNGDPIEKDAFIERMEQSLECEFELAKRFDQDVDELWQDVFTSNPSSPTPAWVWVLVAVAGSVFLSLLYVISIIFQQRQQTSTGRRFMTWYS